MIHKCFTLYHCSHAGHKGGVASGGVVWNSTLDHFCKLDMGLILVLCIVHTCISLVENRLSLTATVNNEVSFIVWEKECLGCQNSPTLLTWPSPVTNPLPSLAEGGVTTWDFTFPQLGKYSALASWVILKYVILLLNLCRMQKWHLKTSRESTCLQEKMSAWLTWRKK